MVVRPRSGSCMQACMEVVLSSAFFIFLSKAHSSCLPGLPILKGIVLLAILHSTIVGNKGLETCHEPVVPQ